MKLIFAALLSLVSAGQAFAADAELPGPIGLPPSNYYPRSYYPISPPVNWAGLYGGLNGGYDFGNSNWMSANQSTGGFKVNGELIGGTLGINFLPEARGRLLFGVESDVDWSNANGSSSIAACSGIGAPAGASCQTKGNWVGTIRVRAGYVVENVLVFGTAGGALGDFQVALSPQSAFTPIGPQFGWTAGGGVEYAFSDRVTAKLEYLYVNLGTVSCPNNNACPAANSVSLIENLVRVGVNYKFSW